MLVKSERFAHDFDVRFPEIKMLMSVWLALVALVATSLGANPGVKVKLTEKGLEYGKACS